VEIKTREQEEKGMKFNFAFPFGLLKKKSRSY